MAFRFVLRFGAVVAAASLLGGCAEERAPINQVQANALQKAFFVGANLASPEDDPEFYSAGTIIDVPFGADSAGVFPGLVGSLRRVKFEITQNYLNVRLTHEEIEGTDGHGTRTTNNGRIIASFPITSHFDIRRAYNSSTGEELNVVVENTSDRAWYEREYFRVDWGNNLITTSMWWDPIAQQSAFGDTVSTEPLAYNVTDPNHPDAPVFVPEEGYFDVTNRIYLKPRKLTIFGQTVSACLYRGSFVLGASGPWGNCENSEVTIRYSFRRVPQPGESGYTDYEPVHWDGERMNAFGIFTQDRMGADPRYGVVDNKWYRFAQRYNLWQRSHVDIACDVPDPPVAGVFNPDGNNNGTDDVCEQQGAPAGSRCDDIVGRCTLPYALRTVAPVRWYYTVSPAADPVLRRFTELATQEWDAALRVAVQSARLVECRKTGGASLAGSPWAGQSCEQAFPIQQPVAGDGVATRDDVEILAVKAQYACWAERGFGSASCAGSNPNAVAAMLPVVTFCPNPVEPGSDPACGPPGTRVRPGDIRYHHINVWPTRYSNSPWGYGPSLADPLTGEIVSAGINVYDFVTNSAAQAFVDQLRWMNGEIKGEDISSGTFIRDWALGNGGGSPPGAEAMQRIPTPAEQILTGGALLPVSEIETRLAAVTRLDPALARADHRFTYRPPHGLDPAALKARLTQDLGKRRLPTSMSGNPRAQFDHRLALARGTDVEAQLMNTMWLQAGGLQAGTPVDEEVLEAASPLRGMNPFVLVEAERDFQLRLARAGQCMLGAPEPTGLPTLARVMARKFPLREGESNQQRIDRMFDYLRGRMHYSVILHEMGHTVGLRHNFVSSFDSMNFRPQYWQLRTDNGRVTQVCDRPSPDGSNCIGPRYWDGLTQAELDGSIWTWQHTTVMDYPGDLSQDLLGLGVYDLASVRMFYADVVDVALDPALRVDTALGRQYVDLVDNMGGLVGQIIESNGRFTHYSERHNLFKLIRECQPVSVAPPANWNVELDGEFDPVFDGQVVLGTQCERAPVEQVSYRDLVPDRLEDQLNIDPRFFTARRARDSQGRPRVPYGFESDEYADGWSPATYRHDNGADLYEALTFHTNLYENRHFWDNFRNGRSTFSVAGAYNRAISRYHVKLSELSQGVAYVFGWYFEELARNLGITMRDVLAQTVQQGLYKDQVIGAGLAFDHFVRVLTRPHIGDHFGVDLDRDFRPDIAEPEQDTLGGPTSQLGDPSIVTIPNGTTILASGDLMFGGRPLNNAFSYGNGYWSIDYLNQVGSYYEKALATQLMLSASYNVINFWRFDGLDGRFHHVNYVDLWPDAMRRMIGSMLTGDRFLYAPRLPVDPVTGGPDVDMPSGPEGPLWPREAMGWVSFNRADGPEVCWPKNGVLQCRDAVSNTVTGNPANVPTLAIDPQLGYEVQKFIAFWSYVYMPEAQEMDWVDMMRIYVVGKDVNPDYLPQATVEFVDPFTGQRYIARRYGDETLLGRTYDKGIAAKMIQWANQLVAQTYEVASVDPVTGAVTIRRDAAGNPVFRDARARNCDDSKACTELRAYRGLMDYMRVTAARLGFPEPALQVIGWSG